MLKIVDLEVGNIGSVIKAIKHLGVDYEVVNRPEMLSNASKIILPGVGNFAAASRKLFSSGFVEVLHKHVQELGTPVLGICVGMQLLAKGGEEGGPSLGLGYIDATVSRINDFDSTLLVPHMGWNDVTTNSLPIFKNIDDGSCFYFVHSFAMRVASNETVDLAHTEYGENIVAYVRKGNIHGAQFHPEKSQTVGLKFLRNFIEEC